MKIYTLMSMATAFAIAVGAADAMAQVPVMEGGNPGIVVSGSQEPVQLPRKASSFIDKHYKDVGIRSCEKNFVKNEYDVTLSNGVEIEFNEHGDILEIDASDRSLLPPAIVKDVIPDRAYHRLAKAGYEKKVESIDLTKDKNYEIDLYIAGPDTFIFDHSGHFLAKQD